ncbi:MAG: hypothetical protein ABMB14_05495, partial [Myxococcota bacterium]
PVLGGFLAVNVLLSVLIPVINPFAHFGGLAAGIALGAAPDRPWIRYAEALGLGMFVGACGYGWAIAA